MVSYGYAFIISIKRNFRPPDFNDTDMEAEDDDELDDDEEEEAEEEEEEEVAPVKKNGRKK